MRLAATRSSISAGSAVGELCPGGSRGHDQPQEQAQKLEHRCMLPSRSIFTIARLPSLVQSLGPALVGRYVRRMCGRVRLSSDVSEIKLVFSIPPHRPAPNIAPSWNVAPTDPLPVVRHDAKAGEPSLDLMRWGLVPFWAKDIKVGFSNIN